MVISNWEVRSSSQYTYKIYLLGYQVTPDIGIHTDILVIMTDVGPFWVLPLELDKPLD